MLSSHGLYSDESSPMTGIMIVGHGMDPKREDVKGQIIKDLSDAFGFSRDYFEKHQGETGEFISRVLDAMDVENRYCRCVVYRTDDDGEDLPPLYFGLTEWPDEAEGYEEDVRYHWCNHRAKGALPVTVFEWDEKLSLEIEKASQEIFRAEWNKRQANTRPSEGGAS